MIKKVLFFSLVFIVSLVGFLVSSLPASLLWENVLQQELKKSVAGLDVLSVGGTVWDGNAQVSYKKIALNLDWSISFSGVLALSLPVELKVNGPAGNLLISSEIGLDRVFVSLESADINLAQLTPLVKRQRVVLDGALVVKDLLFEIHDQKIVFLSGLGSWSGGDVTYPVGRQSHERSLPAFRFVAETNDEGFIHIGIRDSDAAFDVIDISLDERGEAMVKVTRRLLDLAGEDWPKNSKESDIIFKVKKVIY